MNKETRDYMREKVNQYDSLKDTLWWLENAKEHAKDQGSTIGGTPIYSKCNKDIANHLTDSIISLICQEIQAVERQMEEI